MFQRLCPSTPVDRLVSESIPSTPVDRLVSERGKDATSCASFPGLTNGQMYPEDATSAEATVGAMDVAVTRDDTVDFSR